MLQSAIDQYIEVVDRFQMSSGMALLELKNRKRLLFVDPADYNTQHIYFDSKLGLGNEQCRLEVRDVISGEKLPFESFINIYAAQVEPHRALLESDYFLKLIEMCEITRDAEISAIESGQPFSAVQAQNPKDADVTILDELKQGETSKPQLSNEDYLTKSVMPLVYNGLKILAAERPQNPLKYLALYMLQNQDKVFKGAE